MKLEEVAETDHSTAYPNFRLKMVPSVPMEDVRYRAAALCARETLTPTQVEGLKEYVEKGRDTHWQTSSS